MLCTASTCCFVFRAELGQVNPCRWEKFSHSLCSSLCLWGAMQTELEPAGMSPPGRGDSGGCPKGRVGQAARGEGLCSTRLPGKGSLLPFTSHVFAARARLGRALCRAQASAVAAASPACCQGGWISLPKPTRGCLTFFCHMAKVSPPLCLSEGQVVSAAGAGFIFSVVSLN